MLANVLLTSFLIKAMEKRLSRLRTVQLVVALDFYFHSFVTGELV